MGARVYVGRPSSGDDRGFTLVEAAIAVSLLGLLLGGLYGLFSGSIMAWRRAEERAELEQHLRLVTRLLREDLENLVGGVDSRVKGVGPNEGEDTGGYLQLATGARRMSDGGGVEVRYSVTTAGLTRQVLPLPALQVDVDDLSAEEPELISPLVRRLEPRFLMAETQEEGWQESADVSGGTDLPVAFQLAVWVGRGNDPVRWQQRTLEVNRKVNRFLSRGVP